MIYFQGISINIKKPTLCRVTLSLPITNFDFLLTSDWNKIHNRYAGIILKAKKNNIYSCSIPIFFLNQENILNEGDILLIEPNGIATKIYDSLSVTNSILLTERCNSKCLTCPQPPKQYDDIDLVNLAVQSMKIMNPAPESLGITGGEPTLEWEGLIKSIETANKYLPNTQIQLLTNARILKDYRKAKELASIGGEKLFVGVPLYSDVDEIHDELSGKKGAFWDTIEGLYNLERSCVFTELRVVITKINYKRLPILAEFIYKTLPFVGYVAFMAMEPIGNALKHIEKLWIDPIDYMNQLDQAIKILWRRDIGVELFNHQICTLPQNLWGLAKKSISEWKIVYMDECLRCSKKADCGGFFFSATKYKSGMISAIY